MYFHRFFYEPLAHASFLVGCTHSQEALVVDPGRDITPYLELAHREGMQITAIAETHIHADLLSGAKELAERTHASLYLSGEGGAGDYAWAQDLPHRFLRDNDEFTIGGLRIKALHTPGHTPEHLSFLLTQETVRTPLGLFTGDFLFVGDAGRPDLLEKAIGVQGNAAISAKALYHSIQRIRSLPDHLQIWPSHGAGSACGKALGSLPMSTLGYEKQTSWVFQDQDIASFLKKIQTGQPTPPPYFSRMKKWNRSHLPLLRERPKPERFTAEDIRQLDFGKDGFYLVDTRPAGEFLQSHIKGSLCLPHNRSFIQWAGWFLEDAPPLVVIVDEKRQKQLERDLAMIGLDHIAGILPTSEITRFQASELERVIEAEPSEIAQRVNQGDVTVIDVRNDSEWEAGHLPQALHIPLTQLTSQLDTLSKDRPLLLQCKAGGRSAIASSLLQAQGYDVINLRGGWDRWMECNLPTCSSPASSS
ncbi:hydroxyacylglutathione hydrolase [Marininema mesophilum]|uniref:Hydroxyacylglutathione hydrolase n=1 Tax=Marininema mesophilum TaxID=1048340 RepID=A0A1H2QIC7_9BACL|nr:MBL fold metallo-hydrolase [Marininema mesophilum]SDW06963.1 hydroxyacylglutathione hydrolase [Marininema mesophilum]